MIRLPKPPKGMVAPSPVLDYFNKFNEVIKFTQDLTSAIDIQQRQNNLTTSVSTQQAEKNSEANSWFNG
jgi:hypothetical protein|tara:strand:- start:587 stop:793 length:207 start_codon:yes stop_codon:yes gene_type:complete